MIDGWMVLKLLITKFSPYISCFTSILPLCIFRFWYSVHILLIFGSIPLSLFLIIKNNQFSSFILSSWYTVFIFNYVSICLKVFLFHFEKGSHQVANFPRLKSILLESTSLFFPVYHHAWLTLWFLNRFLTHI